MVDVHRAFARDTKNVGDTQILDTTSWKVVVLPTRHSPSHPSSGHTHNTNPDQLVRDTCSAKVGKADYTHPVANFPVH